MALVQKVGIAGGGVMGSAIALVFARAGCDVTVYDMSEKCLASLTERVLGCQEIFIRTGEMTREEAAQNAARVHGTSEMKDLAGSGLVIEAILERMDVKQSFFAELENYVSEDTILATNTSGLSVNEIGRLLKKGDRFVGANWWTPAYIIPLVEIVSAGYSAPGTAQKLRAILESVGKKPICIKREVPGFVGNRMQFVMLREALHILDEGLVSAEDIDRVLTSGLGARYAVMGPLMTADYGGVDTFAHICENLFPELATDQYASETIRKLEQEGHYGLKTGKGFYDYSGKDPVQLQAERDKKLIGILKLTEGK